MHEGDDVGWRWRAMTGTLWLTLGKWKKKKDKKKRRNRWGKSLAKTLKMIHWVPVFLAMSTTERFLSLWTQSLFLANSSSGQTASSSLFLLLAPSLLCALLSQSLALLGSGSSEDPERQSIKPCFANCEIIIYAAASSASPNSKAIRELFLLCTQAKHANANTDATADSPRR